jgi:hypothetical protein
MITSEQEGVATFGEMRRAQLDRSQPMGWTAFKVDSNRCLPPREIDTRSASAMNDSRQLGSAVPELRSTWRTRSSCGVYRKLLQAATQA